MGMIVRRACADAFEFGNANPDLRNTQVVLEFGILARHSVPLLLLLLWRIIQHEGCHVATNFLISAIIFAALMPFDSVLVGFMIVWWP